MGGGGGSQITFSGIYQSLSQSKERQVPKRRPPRPLTILKEREQPFAIDFDLVRRAAITEGDPTLGRIRLGPVGVEPMVCARVDRSTGNHLRHGDPGSDLPILTLAVLRDIQQSAEDARFARLPVLLLPAQEVPVPKQMFGRQGARRGERSATGLISVRACKPCRRGTSGSDEPTLQCTYGTSL